MINIKLVGTQEFMGMVIPIIYGGFGENQKIVADRTVGTIHNQPTREIRMYIINNPNRFSEYVDYIDLKYLSNSNNHISEILKVIGYTK